MGGSSVPSSTAQFQQLATGIWGSPEASAMYKPILKPAMANIKSQQEMLMGFQSGDPEQTRKFLGLPPTATRDEVVHSIAQHTQGPQIQVPQFSSQQPTKTAAQGGIMSLDDGPARDPRRGFAPGGSTTKSLTPQQRQIVMNVSKIIADGGTLTDAQKARINTIEKNTGLNVSPFVTTGTATPVNKTVASAVASANTAYQKSPEALDTTAIKDALASQNLTPANAYVGKAGLFGSSITKDPVTGADVFQVTNPAYNKAYDVLQGMTTVPGQFGGATTAYEDAIAGLKNAAQYQAKDVTGATISPVSSINAPTAVASSYDASQMVGPTSISAQGYDAAQMNAATMQGAQNIAANRLQQYQMDRDRIRNLQAQRAQVAEMTGPESWTQRGVAEKYMNPYVKTALASQQELANLDLQRQLQDISGQAAGRGAFGGSKTQLALASARRNQDLANRNMAAQGLSQAYTQGMGQFTTEQQMSQAAKNANQAAANAANLNYQAQQLAAQQANQGMDYNTALQNMQAKLGVQAAQQQADLTAAQANQLYGYGGFQSQAQNLASLNQASANNMQAINNQRSQYVTQALQAAQANQQAVLTTEQQNMIARNAASQFNAENASRISQANAQMNLAAQQSNQQTALATAQQNAQLAQAANLANQQAGLAANQQNIGALGQAAGAAQGLGALGTSIGNYNANLAGLFKGAGDVIQNLGTSAYNQIQTNAGNIIGGPEAVAGKAGTLLNAAGSGTSGVIGQTANQGR